MEKASWIKEGEGKDEVHYLRLLSGSHKDEVVRLYGVRSKDKVLYGRSLSTKKVIVFGRSTVDVEFLKHRGLEVSTKSNSNYEDVLNKFK